MARVKKEYTIVVEGGGAFPDDMLRYDNGRFATEADEAIAHSVRGRRKVTVICQDRPTVGRWESFTWKVVEG